MSLLGRNFVKTMSRNHMETVIIVKKISRTGKATQIIHQQKTKLEESKE